MELFYSQDISGQFCSLDEQESRHCVKVLRHKAGDIIKSFHRDKLTVLSKGDSKKRETSNTDTSNSGN